MLALLIAASPEAEAEAEPGMVYSSMNNSFMRNTYVGIVDEGH